MADYIWYALIAAGVLVGLWLLFFLIQYVIALSAMRQINKNIKRTDKIMQSKFGESGVGPAWTSKRKAGRLSVGLSLAACLSMLAVACVTGRVQEKTLLPAIQQAWSEVRLDTERGIPSAEDLDILRAHLEGFDESVWADKPDVVKWRILRPWADTGIDIRLSAGEIGPSVAGSRRERVKNFTAAVEEIQ